MKYVFEIATEPTIHVAISIIIVILSSFAFTKNVIMSGDPHVGIFSTTMRLAWFCGLFSSAFLLFYQNQSPNPKLINYHFDNGQR